MEDKKISVFRFIRRKAFECSRFLSTYMLLMLMVLPLFGESISEMETKAMQLFSEEKYEQSLKILENVLVKYDKTKNAAPWWIIRTCGNICLYWIDPVQPEKAVLYGVKLLAYDDKEAISEGIRINAEAFWSLKEYKQALKYINLYLEKGTDDGTKKTFIGNLATYYYQAGDFENAFVYAKRAGTDFWLYKRLAPRSIAFNFNFKFKEYVTKHMSYLKKGLVKINLPMDTYYQSFVSLKSTPVYTRIIKAGRYNFAEYDFSKGFPEKLKMQIIVHNQVTICAPGEVQMCEDDDTDCGYYANHADSYFNLDDVKLQKRTFDIVKGTKTNKEKIIAIQDWISRNITHCINYPQYDGNSSQFPPIQNAAGVLDAKCCSCNHFSALFVCMCRILKIPARGIKGFMAMDGYTEKDPIKGGLHEVVEIYDMEKKTWIFIEPQKYNLNLGESEQWLIICESEMRKPLFENSLSFFYLYDIAASDYGNYEFVKMEIQHIE